MTRGNNQDNSPPRPRTNLAAVLVGRKGRGTRTKQAPERSITDVELYAVCTVVFPPLSCKRWLTDRWQVMDETTRNPIGKGLGNPQRRGRARGTKCRGREDGGENHQVVETTLPLG